MSAIKEQHSAPTKDEAAAMAEAKHQEGLKFLESGNHDAALLAFKKALHFNYDRSETHYMLGATYHQNGMVQRAIDHYQIATVLAPRNIENWIKLAYVRMQDGRYFEAFTAMRMARRCSANPNEDRILRLMTVCISLLPDFDIDRHIVDEVTACLQHPQIDPPKLIPTALKLLAHQDIIQKLHGHLGEGYIRDFELLLKDRSLNWAVLNHPLFRTMLATALLPNADLESLLTALRSHILQMSRDAGLSENQLWPDALSFVCALAQQCFLNEYIYDEKEKDSAAINMLERRIINDPDFNPYDIAVYACFRPLYALQNSYAVASDKTLRKHAALNDLLRVQIDEPETEKKIRNTLETHTSIDDEISLLVKEQYEAFPYPRWVKTGVPKQTNFSAFMRFMLPHIAKRGILPPDDFKPETLIAGCGTGMHPILHSMVMGDGKITAIDLSAASLAYAKRKADELGMDYIRFGIADILKIRELKQSFDLIEANGVLHHMRDPQAGWQALCDVLKPGGYMMIALYSEIGRRSIVAAREYIAQQNIPNTEDGIRKLRRQVKKLPESHPVKRTADRLDFYSMSDCRDLLFHVQEHRFSTHQLKKNIDALGLEFLGFKLDNPMVMRQYKAMYPNDPDGLDLANWHEFELKFPSTFANMYTLWLRKPEK
ncbi:MAG: methyltransferase domain-containing protein [Magnetococcus sp. WYHC-3]